MSRGFQLAVLAETLPYTIVVQLGTKVDCFHRNVKPQSAWADGTRLIATHIYILTWLLDTIKIPEMALQATRFCGEMAGRPGWWVNGWTGWQKTGLWMYWWKSGKLDGRQITWTVGSINGSIIDKMGIFVYHNQRNRGIQESVTVWQYQVWAILPILSDFLGFRSESISEDEEKRQDSEPWQYASSYHNQQLYQNTPGCTHITQMDVIPPRTK